MARTRYLIVGASGAGMAAAQAIRQLDPPGFVKVIGKEAEAPYFRPLIPYLISRQKTGEELELQGHGPYRASGIELLLQTRAKEIDTEKRELLIDRDTSLPFDRLLIATGSRPYIPENIEGLDIDGVFTLRTLAQARRAARRADITREAVMLGGGLLNLKCAFALLERRIAVTLVVYSPEVLSQLMEPDDAALIRSALDRAGLTIITGRNCRRILGGEQGVSGVVLDDGSELPCQMVCIGKGVRPNIEWLRQSRVVRVEGGVVVDRYTHSSTPGVFAAGDVAVTFDPITGEPMVTGLWTNAVDMGRCAGANMAGHPTAYAGTFGILNATQVARMPFVSMGIVHATGGTFETHVKDGGNAYRKLIFSPQGDRLVGALFVGDIEGAGLYRAVIRERRDIREIKKEIIDHRLHYGHLLRLPAGVKGELSIKKQSAQIGADGVW